jgi:uncharacterized protein (DUF2147 family)
MATAPRRARRGARLRAGALVLGVLGAMGALLAALPLAAQELTPAGLWLTVSDDDGKPKSLVRIREVQGEFVGVVEQVLNPEKRNSLCADCPGERHNQPVLGLTILTGVHRDGDHFGGGQILDPNNGKLYSCKLTPIDGGKRMEVRGFLGFSLFGRTQTWERQE